MLDFARLRTPAAHGDVLVEPGASQMRALAEANRELLASYTFPVLDTNIGELRASIRHSLCGQAEGPVVATGHQPEFIHAGVWAKHVVAVRLAQAVGGRAVNVIVDSDAPKNERLVVPHVSGSFVEVRAVSYAAIEPGAPFESIPRMEDTQRVRFANTVRQWLGDRFDSSSLPAYFRAMAEAVDARDWVDQAVSARRAVEGALGVAMIEHRIGRVWFGPMLADMMVHAERFSECYNRALAEYRRAHHVRAVNRPIPDLVRVGSRVELPLWVYRLGEVRRRFFIERSKERLVLYADSERFGELSLGDLGTWEQARVALVNQGGYVFRPRALMVTLWARMFLADLFIHGIGGARYDLITDGFIRCYWGVEPPGFGCVSATLWMDLPRRTKESETLQRSLARLRDVRYNPQRHLDRTAELARFFDQRCAAVEESIALRERAPRERIRRREVFERIRSASRALVDRSPSVVQEGEKEVADARRRARSDQAARRRDYFFAMLETSALELLLDRLPGVEAFRV
ncbi:MAG: hypothetical protein IID39_00945 [Planctomycetes bacterium]|nr:hypothetical protein [Planctomycetota bacterium]